MKQLSEEILAQEHQDWLNEYGKGRNERDLRFGQHIWNEYTWQNQISGPGDGFYAEDPDTAYVEIMYQMTDGKDNSGQY